MRKTLVSVLLAGSLAAGGAVAFTSSVSAGAATSSPAASATAKHAKHPGLRKAIRRAVVRISAKTIGVTPKDLVSELKSGKSIADVANEHNVAPSTVVNALVKAGDAALQRAVKNHRITEARAKKIAARLPALATKVVNHHFGH